MPNTTGESKSNGVIGSPVIGMPRSSASEAPPSPPPATPVITPMAFRSRSPTRRPVTSTVETVVGCRQLHLPATHAAGRVAVGHVGPGGRFERRAEARDRPGQRVDGPQPDRRPGDARSRAWRSAGTGTRWPGRRRRRSGALPRRDRVRGGPRLGVAGRGARLSGRPVAVAVLRSRCSRSGVGVDHEVVLVVRESRATSRRQQGAQHDTDDRARARSPTGHTSPQTHSHVRSPPGAVAPNTCCAS